MGSRLVPRGKAGQHGLLLLTAHRAKGLEFDHVVILDGGWDRTSLREDADAARRLFYVAATRARTSLAMTAMEARHPILNGEASAGLLERQVAPDVAAVADCALHHEQAHPGMVDLSFAGRLNAADPALRAIASIEVGDPLGLVAYQERWLVKTTQGITVGRMAKAYRPPAGMSFLRGEVRAVILRRKADSAEEYHDSLRRDEWEVVLPEFVFTAQRT